MRGGQTIVRSVRAREVGGCAGAALQSSGACWQALAARFLAGERPQLEAWFAERLLLIWFIRAGGGHAESSAV